MDKQLVVKSNFLVEASFRLSSIEQKIILTLATKIKKTDEEFQKYLFNLGELSRFLGLTTNADYSYLQEVTKNLLSKVLTIGKENYLLQTHWLESVTYFEKDGTVALNFNPELRPFLLQIKNNFTRYQLKYAIQLKSRFSIRIYELLKQYEKIGYRDFLLEELRERLGIRENEYSLYGNFKAKVLLVAQREMKAKTDLSFTFEEVKIGRGVGKLRFHIEAKKIEEAALTNTEEIKVISVPPKDENLERAMGLLPSNYQALESIRKLLKNWLEKEGFDYVARNIGYANDGSNAVNPGANITKGSNYRVYLAKALTGDFGLAHKEDKDAKKQAELKTREKALEAANAHRERQEQTKKEKEDIERARVFQQSLSAEGMENLKLEAFARLTPENQELVRKKSVGSDMLLKIMMDKISCERMKIS